MLIYVIETREFTGLSYLNYLKKMENYLNVLKLLYNRRNKIVETQLEINL